MNPSIPYWLCGVNFKINTFPQTPASTIYHTDSVESTSKCNGRSRCCTNGIPYWLCGVNFKIKQCKQWISKFLYHTDSVESTSKWCCHVVRLRGIYTILTLWSQLQNNGFSFAASTCSIPYWLCGVNFKMTRWCGRGSVRLYHTDSVESTSKYTPWMIVPANEYTILTLWSQLQNKLGIVHNASAYIPYWLCGVNFKMVLHHYFGTITYTILTLWSQLQNGGNSCRCWRSGIPYWLCGVNFKIGGGWGGSEAAVYHTDSVESTSKWWRHTTKPCHAIPYWLCGVNFKMYAPPRSNAPSYIPYWLCGVNFKILRPSSPPPSPLYHTDSVESTSK